jgi:nucleoid DNA-binding protein
MQSVRRTTGLTLRETSVCIDSFIEAISEALSQGERVELRGLGTFAVRITAPRKYTFHNLQTAITPAHGKIIFRPSQKLRISAWNCTGNKHKSS